LADRAITITIEVPEDVDETEIKKWLKNFWKRRNWLKGSMSLYLMKT